MKNDSTKSSRCASCGSSLAGAGPVELCLTCFVSQAIEKMNPSCFLNGAGSSDAHVSKSFERALVDLQIDQRRKDGKNGQVKSSKKAESRARDAKQLKSVKRGKRAQLITCVLCGKEVARGTLLAHKQESHGEVPHTVQRANYRETKSVWISFVSGGLPGLGKRR